MNRPGRGGSKGKDEKREYKQPQQNSGTIKRIQMAHGLNVNDKIELSWMEPL
jgi:hypothetical protein